MSATTTVSPVEVARDTSRPVPFLRAARAVFDISAEGMLWSRRSLTIGIFLALPIAFALVFRFSVLPSRSHVSLQAMDVYALLLMRFYVRLALPLAALFYASALIADEVEGRTLTYLLTRPVRRASVLAGKFAAYLATTLSLALPPVVVTFFVLATTKGTRALGTAAPDLFRDLGVTALALLAYGALFALFGVLLRRPLIPGLIFIFGWELLVSLTGYLPRLTITAYLQSLIRHQTAARDFTEVLPAALSLGALAGVTVVALALAVGIFSSREYVMEQ